VSDRAAALVVLRPAGGGEMTEPITTSNLRASVPDPEVAERVRSAFAEQGLTVGPLVGNSFSVEGDRERFQTLFPDLPEKEGSGAELDPSRLPQEARDHVQAVVTEAPPEFGPWNP
jgi:hypothetical protein